MTVLINIPEERFADIQRIASVQVERRVPSVEQIIANGTPTIEPERKTGKWEITNLGAVGVFDSCSECKRVVKHKAPFYNFCPHCGAKMGGCEEK